jgi:hypothetical protein
MLFLLNEYPAHIQEIAYKDMKEIIMPKSKKTKRSIEFYLVNFATWLNKAEYDPAISSSAGKKIVKVSLKYDPKENIAGFSNELSKVLKTFLTKLTSDPHHHEKLAKEYKKKLTTLDMHLNDALESSNVLAKGRAPTLRALQKTVSSSLTKVTNFLKRIMIAKHQIKSKNAKGYSDPHHLQSLTHLTSDKRHIKNQIPIKRRSGKTERGGHNE